jgi:hypothetical protein
MLGSISSGSRKFSGVCLGQESSVYHKIAPLELIIFLVRTMNKHADKVVGMRKAGYPKKHSAS